MANGSGRETLRLPFVAASRVLSEGRSAEAMLCNLSCGGASLRVERTPRGEAEVAFPLPDGGPRIVVRAAVKWTRPDSDDLFAPLPVACGVRFESISDADRDRIQRQVDRFLRVPTPVVGIVQPRSGLMRVPLVVPCTLAGAFGVLRGRTCNLGAHGVYVAVEPILEPGERVELRVNLPEPLGRFEKQVLVSWRNPRGESSPHMLPPGHGLHFEDLSRLEVGRLVRLVDEYLARMPRVAG